MDFSVALDNLNWMAVLTAWVVSMGWGFIWYSKNVMGSQWMKAAGLKQKDVEKASSTAMFAMAVLSFISAVVLTLILSDLQGWVDGVFDGAVIGAGLVAANQTVMYVFQQKPMDLIKIDGVSVVVNYALMGLVLSLF